MKQNYITAVLLSGATLIALSLQSQADLVAYWNFDETTGITAADTSGSATVHDATWQDGSQNGLTWSAGQIGNAATMAGTNDAYEFHTTPTSLNGATSWTAGGWFKRSSAVGGYKGLLTAQVGMEVTTTGANNTSSYNGINSSTVKQIDCRINNNNAGTVSSALSDNAWHHVMYTYDGNTLTHRMWVDGVETTPGGTIKDVTGIVTAGLWHIGRDRTIGGRCFGGQMDDWAIWDEALSPSHVLIIYNNGLNGIGVPGDPVDFDGDGISDADEASGDLNPFDASGNNVGVPNGAPTLADNADSDGDGVLDGDEINTGTGSAFLTDPNDADTDGDGYSDGDELSYGSDPTDDQDFPDYFSNLVGYWPLDNAVGTTATEKSGFDAGGANEPADGVLQNADGVTWKHTTGAGDGICGYADLSNVTGSYFRINPIPGLESSNPQITIMGWVKPRSTGYRGIFMTRDVDDNIGTNRNWGLAVDDLPNNNSLEGRFSSGPLESPAASLTFNSWQHVAMTWDGSTRKLFINGVEVSSEAYSAVTEIIDSRGWSLGCDNVTAGRQINGCLDDFAVFNAAVLPAVISDIYNAGLAGNNLLTVFPSAPSALAADDFDNDDFCDQWEIDFFGDITTSDFAPGTDTDGDGLDDFDEVMTHGTDPDDDDTDNDGINDGDELSGQQNPFQSGVLATAPGDATDPLDEDSDDDNVLDGDEVNGAVGSAYITDPNNADTDDDGIVDGTEITDGTDPTDPSSGFFPLVFGDLVAYYDFDEGSGTTATDEGLDDGSAQNASQNQGTIGWTTTNQKLGAAALDLPGNASMTVATPLDGSTTAYTICVWINPDDVPGYDGIYMHRRASDNLNNWGIALEGSHSDNRFDGSPIDSPNEITIGDWQHLACTWDNGGNREIFINGVSKGGDATATTVFDGFDNDWRIGDDPAINGRELNAQLDDLAVFSSVLSDAEIKSIYDAGNAGVPVLDLIPNGHQDWRLAYFADPYDRGDGADGNDFNGNGFENLLDFAFGFDPVAGGPAPGPLDVSGGTINTNGPPIPNVENVVNGVNYTMRFTRRADYIAAGLTYTVQFSYDMSVWENSAESPAVIGTGTGSDGNAIEAVEVTFPFFLDDGRRARFARVSVSN